MVDTHSFAAKIPAGVHELLAGLSGAGYDAVLVGGCVRDLVLGLCPSDFDIATSATPDDVLSLFSDRHCLTVGKAFGTVIVPYPGGHAEVTTFREETGYTDGRHPDVVHFSRDLQKDLARRDFTVNAMAWRNGALIDPFGGQNDLRDRILRTVGEADKRLGEDVLRILRGVRFATRYGLTPDPAFLAAATRAAPHLKAISAERIREELDRMLLGEKPSCAFRLMQTLGVLAVILPEIAAMHAFSQDTPYHHLDLLEHTLCVTDTVPKDPDMRWAALLHDIGKPATKFFDEEGTARYFGHDKASEEMAVALLAGLRTPGRQIERIRLFVRHHMASANAYTKRSVKKLLGKMQPDMLEKLFVFQEADSRCAQNQGTANIVLGRQILSEVLAAEEPYSEKQLAISGHDLLAIGIEEGPEIGKWLHQALEWVEQDPDLNEPIVLIDKIQNKRRKN